MSDLVDVAIVGAGPYGLSLAAHLGAAGVRYRQFGRPMDLWRTSMPRGMYLKSQGFASNLSDPDGADTLATFCHETGRPYADYGLPVSLRTFVDYGEWFRMRRAPGVERALVDDISPLPDVGRRNGSARSRGRSSAEVEDPRFAVTLDTGEQVRARNVVVAAGVEHFARVPEALSHLPSELCTHSSAHQDLSAFSGHEVVVVGAGQSALESAALLHEGGASVRLLTRRRNVAWNNPPLAPHRPLLQRMREPEAGLGSGLSTWFYSEHPRLFRRLPASQRAQRARTALGPAGAWWLRERVVGNFPVQGGLTVERAEPRGGGVQLGVRFDDGHHRRIDADHVLSATGYPPDVSRLPFLATGLRSRLRVLDGTPRVGGDYQSSVPGLFFVGALVAPTFGPVMRFVYGADHAVRAVADEVVAGRIGAARAVAA